MGESMGLHYFNLLSGVVLCLTATCMLLYAVRRPEHRGVPVTIGASAYMLGGILWLSSGLVVTAPGRLQVLLGGLRSLPWDVALAYVCYLVARSVGKNHPRTEHVLATGTYVLPGLPLVTGVMCAVYFPQPIVDFTSAGTAELLVPRIRNVIEVGYLFLITTVFLRETFRRSTLHLTAQNASLTLAGVSLSAVMFLNVGTAFVRMIIDNYDVLVTSLATIRDLQLASVALTSLFLLVGIALYDPVEERERLLGRCRDWIKHRHDIEAISYIVFGMGLGNSQSGTRVSAYYYRAADKLGIPHREREQGRLTIVLLALMLDPEYQDKVAEVRKAQQELLAVPEVGTFSLTLPNAGIGYSIRDDALFPALEHAMRLNHSNTIDAPNSRHSAPISPTWVQLAAVLASDARFLPAPLRDRILSGHSEHSGPRVLAAYHTAKRIENSVAL